MREVPSHLLPAEPRLEPNRRLQSTPPPFAVPLPTLTVSQPSSDRSNRSTPPSRPLPRLEPVRPGNFVPPPLVPNRPGKPSGYRPVVGRSDTLMTASTLVAEYGTEVGRSDSLATKLSQAWANRRGGTPATTPVTGPRRSVSTRRLLVSDVTHESPPGSDDGGHHSGSDGGGDWSGGQEFMPVRERTMSYDSEPPEYWAATSESPIHGPLVDSSMHFHTPSSLHPGTRSREPSPI